MNINGIEVFIFDLDDTLVYEVRSADEALIAAGKYAAQCYMVEPEAVKDTVKKNAREIWHSLPVHPYAQKVGISSWEALWADFSGDHEMLREIREDYRDWYRLHVWETAFSELGIDDKELALSCSRLVVEERMKRHILFEQSIEVLDHYVGRYRLALMTNGTQGLQWAKINGAGIADYFEHIFIAGEVESAKPDTAIYEACREKFGVTKEQMVIVGNSCKSDIRGGNLYGIKTIWLNRDNEEPTFDAVPDYEIKELKELYNLL